MSNEEKPMSESQTDANSSHPIATGVGVAGGGVAGAAVGKVVGGRLGAVVGGVVGAIAGGMAGEAIAGVAEEANKSLGLVGANLKPVELPRHYSWEELQALSKPQGELG